jgi:XTP/dITP diphosphohydrolase
VNAAGQRLLLATGNPHKVDEVQAILRHLGYEVVGRDPGVEETGPTFEANALLKARALAAAAGELAIADDSGIEIDALEGGPGVHSARWAGPERDFAKAMARVRDELSLRFSDFARADRSAAFVAVLCLAWPDGHEELAEGRVEGELVDPPRGSGGFGYDPMFVPEGESRTFGEMAPADKQRLSHRARALRRLLAMCFGTS